MAVATRGGRVDGVIFHADRGSQYTSAAFAQVSDGFGIRRSMGRVGSSYDNSLAESFWQGLKREAMHGVFATVRQTRLEIFQWLTHYNARSRHNSLGYLSPIEFEQQHRAGHSSMNPRVHTPGDASLGADPAGVVVSVAPVGPDAAAALRALTAARIARAEAEQAERDAARHAARLLTGRDWTVEDAGMMLRLPDERIARLAAPTPR